MKYSNRLSSVFLILHLCLKSQIGKRCCYSFLKLFWCLEQILIKKVFFFFHLPYCFGKRMNDTLINHVSITSLVHKISENLQKCSKVKQDVDKCHILKKEKTTHQSAFTKDYRNRRTFTVERLKSQGFRQI